jgi:hypothetical protein
MTEKRAIEIPFEIPFTKMVIMPPTVSMELKLHRLVPIVEMNNKL